MRLARAGLLVLLLGALALAGPAQPPHGSALPASAVRAAWRAACETSGYSCWYIPMPQVVTAPMERLRGRYWMGDRHLLIAEGMTPSATLVVMVHEMTHYLQYKHGKWDYTSAGKCWAEHQAFDVSNITARALNDPSMVVDWNLMRIQYNCPL